MEAEAILGLAAANLAACLTPGQNTALVTINAARCGSAGGMWTILGIVTAEAIWTGLAFLAIAGAISLHEDAHLLLEIGCGVVLALFGLSLLAVPAAPAGAAGLPRAGSRRVHRLALGGLVVGLANPLALLFFIAVLPLFVSDIDAPTLAAATAAVCLTSALALAPFLMVSSPMMPRLGQVLMHRAGSVALVATGVVFAFGVMR